jgi:hypothetical protein
VSRGRQLLILIIVLTAFNLSNALSSELVWANYAGASSLLIQATGFIGPAISSECTATRNPILESICACLGDLPGGYCYHISCGIVAVSVVTEQPNQIQIAHR